MHIFLEHYVPLYQAMGSGQASKLAPSDVALKGRVEITDSPVLMTVVMRGGTCDRQAIPILFNGYRRYLLVEDVGVALPQAFRESVT